MSVAKKRRLSPKTSQEKLEDARILFLWKIKEASKTHRITIVSVFGKTCGDTNLKNFSDAIEDLSTQYMNDVTSLYDAFSVNLSFAHSDSTAHSDTIAYSEYESKDTQETTTIVLYDISTKEQDIETKEEDEAEPTSIILETNDDVPETSNIIGETKEEEVPENLNIIVSNEDSVSESPAILDETKQEALSQASHVISETKEEALPQTSHVIIETEEDALPQTSHVISETMEEALPQTSDVVSETKEEALPQTSDVISETKEYVLETSDIIFNSREETDVLETLNIMSEVKEDMIDTSNIASNSNEETVVINTSNITDETKEEPVSETSQIAIEQNVLPEDQTSVVQEQAVSYIIEGEASNEYIQNIEFEDGDYGAESVMYLTLAPDDPRAIEYKDGTGSAIRYIQTQDQQGNIIYTQADEASVPLENAQMTDSEGIVQHVEYVQVSDTNGAVAYAPGDEPMVIEYAAGASGSAAMIEYADALNAGIQYAEVESLPKEIREIQNFNVSIKQEVDSGTFTESIILPTATTSRSFITPKQESGVKKETGLQKKKFNTLERSLLDQLDIKDVVCTVADEKQGQRAEEKDLAKAQLLGETENVADLEFTIAPKFPKVRKRKALEPGETKGISCELCGDILYTQNALTKHKNRMHPEHSEHICCLCYTFCSNKKDLRSHFYNAHNKNELCTCPVCGFSYTTHGDFKDHLRACTFTPEDLGYKKPVFEKKPVKGAHLPFKCKFCSMGFVRKGTLTHHIVVKHLKYTPGSSNSCEVCEKRFLHEYSLIKHYRTKDHIRKVKETYGGQSDEEDEEVNQTAHGFTNITVAPVVKKRGTREQTSLFICYICGRDFNRESSLNIHIAKHKKAFECELCGHKLDSRAQLVIHRRIHTGDTPFVCDLCGKGLRSNKHLYQHKKQMHSDVAYKCTHCGSVFKQLSSLYQHIRKKHGEDAYAKFKKEGARSKLVPMAQSGINH